MVSICIIDGFMWFVNTFFKKNCTIRKTLTQIKPIMLDKFKGLGWKKYYLIFGMCDETFSVNYTSEIPEDVDRGWFYFFVTLLNQFYWVASATIGGIIGSLRSGFLYDSDNDTDCTSKVAGTMATRYLPFFIFKENKKTPEYIQYLGKFLPSAVFGMLVIYCLKNVEVLHGTHGIPEGISILVTAVLHIWKKNMFLSIAGGTICYMLILYFL